MSTMRTLVLAQPKRCARGEHVPETPGARLKLRYLHARCGGCGLHIVQVNGEWFID
ncbi:MAG: hypothetical protein WC729_26135 [Sphingomonas sp.]|uniref:hypothetical protein n=1 Tax=Sphingomonas sp. TaxID=28214 RepID=UPI0035616C23